MSFLKDIGHYIFATLLFEDVCSAAEGGKLETLRVFLRFGSDPDALVWRESFPGESALYLAAWKGQAGAVRMLLAAGADSSMPNGDIFKHTPLHVAVQHGHIDIVRDLLAAGAEVNARTIPADLRPIDYCENPAIAALLAPSPTAVAQKVKEEERERLPQLHAEVAATRRRLTKHMQPAPRL